MKRNSITFKLFIITIAVFVIFISTTLFLQSVFFEKFYTDNKINKMKKTQEKREESKKATKKDEQAQERGK